MTDAKISSEEFTNELQNLVSGFKNTRDGFYDDGGILIINDQILGSTLKIDNFNEDHEEIKRLKLRFENCHFQDVFLENIQFDDIEFFECQFSLKSSFKELFGNIVFSKCEFKDNIFIHSFSGGIQINGSSFNLNFEIEELKPLQDSPSYSSSEYQSFLLRNNTFSESFYIRNITIKNFEFDNNRFLKDCTVHGPCKIDGIFSLGIGHFEKGLNLIGTTSETNDQNIFFINQLDFKTDRPLNLKIQDVNFSELNFQDIVINNESSLYFIRLKTQRLIFDKLVNNGTILMDSLIVYDKQDSELSIQHSKLGNISCLNCDFEKFDRFIFQNSNVLKGTFVNTRFKNKFDSNDTNTWLFFSQLKKVYESAGDHILANKYHALELENYRKRITWISKDFATKLALGANKISTNYGQNWARGLFVILICGILLYYLYLACLPIDVTSKEMSVLVLGFLNFLLPLRKIESEIIPGIPPTTFAAIVDILSRILISYLIYQTIQAFRKYGRRSLN